MKIFIDESGDLGFRPHASEYFVIVAIIVRDDQKIRRCFKEIRRKKLKKSLRDLPEFKYNNTNNATKRRILQCIAKSDLDITYAVLRKAWIYQRLRDKPQIIYNYLTGHLITKIVLEYGIEGEISIYIDKSTYKLVREHFDDYLSYRMLNNNISAVASFDQLNIEHVDSRKEPSIQAADFVAGAIHRRYRDGDDEHYNTIQVKVCIALDFFEGRQKVE